MVVSLTLGAVSANPHNYTHRDRSLCPGKSVSGQLGLSEKTKKRKSPVSLNWQ